MVTDLALVTCRGRLPVYPDDLRATAAHFNDTAAAMPIVEGEPYRRAAQHLVSAAALIDAIGPLPASRSQARRYAIQEWNQ
jgi:hypothetical protein